MVRAIIDGRKTQTRRVVKPQPPPETNSASPSFYRTGPFSTERSDSWRFSYLRPMDDGTGELSSHAELLKVIRCPYGQPGDHLWVRETWAASKHNTLYRASEPTGDPPQEIVPEWDWDSGCVNRWRPSIHMPRRRSRLTLRITDVRVERLQDISIEDAEAEGLEVNNFTGWGDEPHLPPVAEPDVYRGNPALDWTENPREAFRDLWDSINAKTYPWASNPWVWVVSFERVEGGASC